MKPVVGWTEEDSELLMKLALLFHQRTINADELLEEFNDKALHKRNLRSVEGKAYSLSNRLRKEGRGKAVSDALTALTNKLRYERRRLKEMSQGNPFYVPPALGELDMKAPAPTKKQKVALKKKLAATGVKVVQVQKSNLEQRVAMLEKKLERLTAALKLV